MGTHDEDTRKFFAHTRVNCELFQREGAHAQDSIVGRNTTDRIFTHHQKTVCQRTVLLNDSKDGISTCCQALDCCHLVCCTVPLTTSVCTHCGTPRSISQIAMAAICSTDHGGYGAGCGQPPPAGIPSADVLRGRPGPVQRAL
jgi:hypothetical protein